MRLSTKNGRRYCCKNTQAGPQLHAIHTLCNNALHWRMPTSFANYHHTVTSSHAKKPISTLTLLLRKAWKLAWQFWEIPVRPVYWLGSVCLITNKAHISAFYLLDLYFGNRTWELRVWGLITAELKAYRVNTHMWPLLLEGIWRLIYSVPLTSA